VGTRHPHFLGVGEAPVNISTEANIIELYAREEQALLWQVASREEEIPDPDAYMSCAGPKSPGRGKRG
jgi:hypothetical protein